jgi:hypothetical protein
LIANIDEEDGMLELEYEDHDDGHSVPSEDDSHNSHESHVEEEEEDSWVTSQSGNN